MKIRGEIRSDYLVKKSKRIESYPRLIALNRSLAKLNIHLKNYNEAENAIALAEEILDIWIEEKKERKQKEKTDEQDETVINEISAGMRLTEATEEDKAEDIKAGREPRILVERKGLHQYKKGGEVRYYNPKAKEEDFYREDGYYRMSDERKWKELISLGYIISTETGKECRNKLKKEGKLNKDDVHEICHKVVEKMKQQDPELYPFLCKLYDIMFGKFYTIFQLANKYGIDSRKLERRLKEIDFLLFPYEVGRRKWKMVSKVDLDKIEPSLRQKILSGKRLSLDYYDDWKEILEKTFGYKDRTSPYQFMLRKIKKGIVGKDYFKTTPPTLELAKALRRMKNPSVRSQVKVYHRRLAKVYHPPIGLLNG